MNRVGCHRWGWVALCLAFWASSPYRRPAWRHRTPSSSPDCPGRVSRPVPGRRRPPGPTQTCPAGKPMPTDTTAPTDTTEAPTDTTESPPPAAPPYGLTGNWFGARRPVRRGDRSSHEPLPVLPGSDRAAASARPSPTDSSSTTSGPSRPRSSSAGRACSSTSTERAVSDRASTATSAPWSPPTSPWSFPSRREAPRP